MGVTVGPGRFGAAGAGAAVPPAGASPAPTTSMASNAGSWPITGGQLIAIRNGSARADVLVPENRSRTGRERGTGAAG